MSEKATIPVAGLPIVRQLLASGNPAVVFRTRVRLLGEPVDSAPIQALQQAIASSEMARRLLHHRQADGTIATNPYKKWQGPHWTLYSLAEIDYPPGDDSLRAMRDQVYDWLLSEEHLKYPRTVVIPGHEDRVRRCASQEGNAIWYALKLGLVDERTQVLADRLKAWQWPDGGWNCDKRPEARTSSFMETLIPLRALFAYGRAYGDQEAVAAAGRAAEFLLARQLYKRLRDNQVAHTRFTKIAYPIQFYDILFALKVMAEVGRLGDERCGSALELLASKRLPGGGFPLEVKNCKTTDEIETRGSFADWGLAGKTQANEFVTADALHVLHRAGWGDAGHGH